MPLVWTIAASVAAVARHRGQVWAGGALGLTAQENGLGFLLVPAELPVRHVFFSFHYKLDIFRSNVVRMSWVGKGGAAGAGYRDLSMWEEAHTRNDRRLGAMIRDALHGTSVTVVLIGSETASRSWVQHEIEESWARGNGLLGVHIHGIADMRTSKTSKKGANPFRDFIVSDEDGEDVNLGRVVPVYDWVQDEGFANFADWVEEAAIRAGR